jgi:hypothetical protein
MQEFSLTLYSTLGRLSRGATPTPDPARSRSGTPGNVSLAEFSSRAERRQLRTIYHALDTLAENAIRSYEKYTEEGDGEWVDMD